MLILKQLGKCDRVTVAAINARHQWNWTALRWKPQVSKDMKGFLLFGTPSLIQIAGVSFVLVFLVEDRTTFFFWCPISLQYSNLLKGDWLDVVCFSRLNYKATHVSPYIVVLKHFSKYPTTRCGSSNELFPILTLVSELDL